MVKEFEKSGIPTAHITNMTPVAKVTGSNRIIPGVAITNPLCDVSLPLDEQKTMRRNLIDRALVALTTDLTESIFF